MSLNYRKLFKGWEIAIAKGLVSDFQKQWLCLKNEGFEDLLQECLTHWFFVKGKYSSETGASEKTFMRKVVKNKLANLVKSRERKKRKGLYQSASLEAPADDGKDIAAMLDQISARDYLSDDLFLEAALKIDFPNAFKKLTRRQKKLCRLISESGLTVTEASKYLKINRRTTYDELKRIKKIFTREGLREYLE